MAISSTLRPAIWNYLDYRKFISDFYHYKKSLRAGFSYRLFAKRCGFKSPNYLQLVMHSKRNLSTNLADDVAKAMGLADNEARYFRALVKNAIAKTDEEKVQARREALVELKKNLTKQMPADQAKVLSTWYNLLVRELVFLPDFEATGPWIQKRLLGMITESQAEASLSLLVRTGFLVQSKDGQWLAKDPILDTGPEGFDQLRILQMHQQTLKVWSENLPQFCEQDREMGLINIPIARDKIPELHQRMRQFQDEIIGWLQEEKKPDCVVQLGVYLMPVTK